MPPVKSLREEKVAERLAVSKPKRPISAYNIFFRLECKRFFESHSNACSSSSDLNISAVNEAFQEIGSTGIMLQSLETAREYRERPQANRTHRKIHGKIGFHQLTRQLANNWKLLDPKFRVIIEQAAQTDRNIYYKQRQKWNMQRDDVMKKIWNDQVCIEESGEASTASTQELKVSVKTVSERIAHREDNELCIKNSRHSRYAQPNLCTLNSEKPLLIPSTPELSRPELSRPVTPLNTTVGLETSSLSNDISRQSNFMYHETQKCLEMTSRLISMMTPENRGIPDPVPSFYGNTSSPLPVASPPLWNLVHDVQPSNTKITEQIHETTDFQSTIETPDFTSDNYEYEKLRTELFYDVFDRDEDDFNILLSCLIDE